MSSKPPPGPDPDRTLAKPSGEDQPTIGMRPRPAPAGPPPEIAGYDILGVLADYSPYTHHTRRLFETLAALKPERLAIMHGSSFEGDGARAIHDLADAFEQVFGPGGAELDCQHGTGASVPPQGCAPAA